MRLLLRLAMAALLAAPLAARAAPLTPAKAEAIDRTVRDGMARVGVKGLELAVVEDGKVVLTRAYGVRDKAGAPLTTDTVMYGASITKAVFAYTVMRLVDEGKLSLDAPIATMLAKPLPDYGNVDGYGNWGDLAGDERWRKLTPRILLTHSAGFANYPYLEPDGKLKINFEPGSRYAYSGEGINLLQFVIEKGLGIPLIPAVDRLTFGPLGMTRSSLVGRPDWGDNAAQGWNAQGVAFLHDLQKRPRAAGSMDTTIGDVGRFAAALVSGTGLSRRSFEDMLRPQLPITTAAQFPTLQPEVLVDRRFPDLASGLAVETFKGPQGPGFYKGGHNDITANALLCVRRGRRCMVLLGNDVRVEALFPEIARAVLGETGTSWKWKFPQLFH